MSIEQTLYDTLTAASGVTDLVGTKIYPLVAPDSVSAPYVTYQVIATEAHNIVNGVPGSERKVIQLNCISNSYTNAKAVAEAIKAALNSATGYLTSEGDDYFPQTENHRVRLDFSLIG